MLIMSHSSSLNVGEAGGKFKVRRMFGEPTNYRFHAITTEPYTIARICTDVQMRLKSADITGMSAGGCQKNKIKIKIKMNACMLIWTCSVFFVL
jgi:hypothetical protein